MSFVIQNISFSRPENKIINKLTFNLFPGQTLRIQGANGSGKSTLLKILAGLLSPDTGSIRWSGKEIMTQRAVYYENMSYLAYHCALKKYLTPLENITYAYHLASEGSENNNKKNMQEDIGKLFDLFDLSAHQHAPCHTLSAGQRRKVALISLMTQQKKLWLLDEPFTALDPDSIATCHALIAQQRERGGMIVIASHISLPAIDQEITLC